MRKMVLASVLGTATLREIGHGSELCRKSEYAEPAEAFDPMRTNVQLIKSYAGKQAVKGLYAVSQTLSCATPISGFGG
jgi:hypothetical protein